MRKVTSVSRLLARWRQNVWQAVCLCRISLVCCLLPLFLAVYFVKMSLLCLFMIVIHFSTFELLLIYCLKDMTWETAGPRNFLLCCRTYRSICAVHLLLFFPARNVTGDGENAAVRWYDSRLTWRPPVWRVLMDATFLLLPGVCWGGEIAGYVLFSLTHRLSPRLICWWCHLLPGGLGSTEVKVWIFWTCAR